MNKVWLQIFMVMIGGGLVKTALPYSFVWVGIDLIVLGIAYLILRRYPNIDIKSSMIFLGGLTFISILTDLRMVSDMVGSVLTLALLGWMMFGRGGNGSTKFQNLKNKWHK